MMKSPPRTPSAIPALTATSFEPLLEVDDVVDAEVSEAAAAVAAVVVKLATVEEADELEVDEVEVA